MAEIINFPKNENLTPVEKIEKQDNLSVVEHHHYHHHQQEQQTILEEKKHIGLFLAFFHVIMGFFVTIAWLLRLIPTFYSFISSIVFLITAGVIWYHWRDTSYHAGFKLFIILFVIFIIVSLTENYRSPFGKNEFLKYLAYLLLFLSPLLASADSAKMAASSENNFAQKTLHIGEMFSISLPANRTTGYDWKLIEKPKALELISNHYAISKECKKGMVGCFGEQEFKFKATHLGSGKILLHYQRPWEKTFVKTKEISVLVQRKK